MTWQQIGGWRRAAICLAVGVSACSSGKDATSPGGKTGTTPPPDTAFTQFIGRSYSVEGTGQSYECTNFQATTDTYITGFRTAAGPAQYTLYVTESATAPTQAGDHDCTAAEILNSRLLYMSGPGTQQVSFPSGTGLHVKSGQYISLTLQLVNPGASAVSGTTSVLIQGGTAADVVTSAEGFLVGTVNIAIPSDGQVHTAVGGCARDASQQVIGVLPVMNALGVHATLNLTATGQQARTVYDGDYSVTQQLYHAVTGATINVNDLFSITCSYVNNTGETAMFGDGYTDERCFALVYAEPDAGTSIFDCVTGA